MNNIDDIRDDEVLIIVGPNNNVGIRKDKKRRWFWIILSIILLILIILLLWFFLNIDSDTDHHQQETLFEPTTESVINKGPVTPLGNYIQDDGNSYTEQIKTTINDIPLLIFIPHNAVPELALGIPDKNDKNIVLATQAADIRADNQKIVGAFVLKGEPLSRGLSKNGYCGIVDGKLTVGVSENSPLFEEATEKNGYFFRQYPLVDNCRLVENEIKSKSIRKALCDRSGEIMVIMTESAESMHDFAQALVDLQVDNAIYLIGSDSYCFYQDNEGNNNLIYETIVYDSLKYLNFIVWKKE